MFCEIFCNLLYFCIDGASRPSLALYIIVKHGQTSLTGLLQVSDRLHRDLQVRAGAPLLPCGDLSPEEDIPVSDSRHHLPAAGPRVQLRSLLQEPLLQLSRSGLQL